MVLASFKTELEAFAMPPSFLFFDWTTENYATVQERSDYLLYATNSLITSVASTLLGLALGMVQPMVMAALHQLIAPRLHGSAIGLRMMVLNVSSTVMPMLFGVGGAVVGAAHLFWLIAFITGSGSLLVKRLSSDLRRAEHNPPD